jgi:hypothetical protein
MFRIHFFPEFLFENRATTHWQRVDYLPVLGIVFAGIDTSGQNASIFLDSAGSFLILRSFSSGCLPLETDKGPDAAGAFERPNRDKAGFRFAWVKYLPKIEGFMVQGHKKFCRYQGAT